MPGRLQHDCCHAIAWRALELFRPLIRDEEARDAYSELFEIARQELENYDRAVARREAQLRPLGEANCG
jgi:hypothetical protein